MELELLHAGFDVRKVGDGSAALTAVDEFTPDVIILDLMLPGIDGLEVAPAVEFNFFPYSQSTRRQLRALYSLALNPVRYREETIFGKLRETLLKEELSLTLDLREKFGTISVSAEGSNYLHDLGKYRIDTFGIVNLRLYKGLSVYVLGGYSWYHDSQLSLLGREPTYEEQLLRLRELPMTSNHFFAVGFQFQFGSIFTNVINPRFGTSGSGGMHIEIH
ncbi:MAG: response regulator [Candidatus Aminicenantes bacterium]|nr:response regulator [Candidatus Aminicenantes bacterium]